MASRLGTINYEITCGLTAARAAPARAVIAALDPAESVRAVSAALAGGSPAWLVGGVVRDALLDAAAGGRGRGRRGRPASAARAVGAAVGGPVFPLSEAVRGLAGAGSPAALHVRRVALQGAGIEDDLGPARLHGQRHGACRWAAAELIDPHGGRADDLDAGVLRVLGARAYEHDPLRPLRLVRLAAELGMAPDPETERLTVAAAPRLSSRRPSACSPSCAG